MAPCGDQTTMNRLTRMDDSRWTWSLTIGVTFLRFSFWNEAASSGTLSRLTSKYRYQGIYSVKSRIYWRTARWHLGVPLVKSRTFWRFPGDISPAFAAANLPSADGKITFSTVSVGFKLTFLRSASGILASVLILSELEKKMLKNFELKSRNLNSSFIFL